MAPVERDACRDPNQPHLRHSHSASSDQGRALIPMWDSSDPERAPPPLPLNPGSPLTSRAGTSSAIASAHAAMNERARESAYPVALTKRVDSPIRTAAHKRMQSSVRDIGLLLESGQLQPPNGPPSRSASPEKKSRPTTPIRDRSVDRDATPTPSSFTPQAGPGPSHTPIVRPVPRRHQTSILGENTPPQSDTMKALHSMATPTQKERVAKEREPDERDNNPFSNATNNSSSLGRTQITDALSGQILSLTNIAQSLQKEMANLSRRSRDNATDLMSLKEATNARDEDIRKTLRELVTNMKEEVSTRPSTRDPYGGPLTGGDKPFCTSPRSKEPRPFSLPRIPSPNSFAAGIDRSSILSTPSLVDDNPASVAMLERIIHEMGTKEGQDTLIARLTDISRNLSGLASAEKIDQLIDFIKANSVNHAVILGGGSGGGGGNGGNRARPMSPDEEDPRGRERHLHPSSFQNERTSSAPPTRASDLLNDDIIKIIRTVKDSVSQGGGLTAEVKALVRELRGEVLGMGRELGRRLDEISDEPVSKEEVAHVVDEGLAQLRKHMNELLREHRRQSAAERAAAGPLVDYQEVYNAMRSALTDQKKESEPDLCRDDVMDAVKDAWETYKPEITVEQIGLERDEILQCLREGMDQYNARIERPEGATKDEVFAAVVEGLKHFTPPKVETPETLSRDEVLEAVRECLDEFDFPVPPPAIGKEDMVDAVKKGLNGFDFAAATTALVPVNAVNNEDIMDRLREIQHLMQTEFKAVSEEVKRNVAATGRDAEQVLGATKDGFERLRADMESYVDRAAGQGDQEEFMDNLCNRLDAFRNEVTELITRSQEGSKDAIREEIESLRDAVNSSLVPHTPQVNYKEILTSIHEGLEGLREALEHVRTEVIRPKPAPTDLLDALQEGFNDIRDSIEKIGEKPPDLSANDEILDALKEGLDGVRSDLNDVREQTASANEKALTPFVPREELTEIIPADIVKSDDIKNLETLIAELGAKVDAKEASPAPASSAAAAGEGFSQEQMDHLEELLKTPHVDAATKEDIARLEEALKAPASESITKDDLVRLEEALKASADVVTKEDITRLEELLKTPAAEATVSKEDFERLEELLKNPATPDAVSKEDVARLEEALKKLEDGLNNVTATVTATATLRATRSADGEEIYVEGAATREDVQAIETILRNTKSRLDDLIDSEQAVRKDHIDALEALILETKEQLGGVTDKVTDLSEGEQSVKKEHLDAIETVVLESKEQLASINSQMADLSRREDVSMVEAVIGQVHAAFEEMKERDEQQLADPEKVTKSQVAAVATQVLELKTVIDGIEAILKGTDLATLSTKEDLEALGDAIKDGQAKAEEAITQAHSKLDEASEALKTKLDESAEAIQTKLDDSFQAVQDKLDGHVEANAKAFEERQAEIVGVGERISEVQAFLTEFQDLVKSKIEEGAVGIDGLSKVLDSLGETINANATISTDLNAMLDTMKVEFDDSKNAFVGAKIETDEKLQQTTDTIIAKLDEKVNEILVKYAEFQIQMEERTKAGEERDTKLQEVVLGQKTIAEDLKALVDTLGSTVTDSLEKMEEASKTVFSRVEDLATKTEERHTEDKAEHTQTRDELKEAVKLVEGLQTQATEFQPQILESVKDVLLLVGQHFDHSKESLDAVKQHIDDAKPESPPPFPIDEVKYDDTVINEKLDKLVSQADESDKINGERNTAVHEKLDKIVGYQSTSDAAFERLDTIDKVHAQVLATAAEISAFLVAQRKKVEDAHEDRQKMLEETNIAVERRLAEKEAVESNLAALREEITQLHGDEKRIRDSMKSAAALKEEEDALRRQMLETLKQEEEKLRESMKATAALKVEEDLIRYRMLESLKEEEERARESIKKTQALKEEEDDLRFKMLTSLKDEEERLRVSISELRDENERLAKKKVRLTADVSSLETALHLRKEDLNAMEQRAQGLERRILDGVMDHSRVLLMARNAGTRQKRDPEKTMSRKRVSNAHTLQRLPEDDAPAQYESTTPSGTPTPAGTQKKRQSGPRTALNMAVNRSLAPPSGANSPAGSRRIVSLSQMSQNVPTGGLGRSQSVRDPKISGARKSSWAGRLSTSSIGAAGSVPGSRVCSGSMPGKKGYGDDIDGEDKENFNIPEDVNGVSKDIDEPEVPGEEPESPMEEPGTTPEEERTPAPEEPEIEPESESLAYEAHAEAEAEERPVGLDPTVEEPSASGDTSAELEVETTSPEEPTVADDATSDHSADESVSGSESDSGSEGEAGDGASETGTLKRQSLGSNAEDSASESGSESGSEDEEGSQLSTNVPVPGTESHLTTADSQLSIDDDDSVVESDIGTELGTEISKAPKEA